MLTPEKVADLLTHEEKLLLVQLEDTFKSEVDPNTGDKLSNNRDSFSARFPPLYDIEIYGPDICQIAYKLTDFGLKVKEIIRKDIEVVDYNDGRYIKLDIPGKSEYVHRKYLLLMHMHLTNLFGNGPMEFIRFLSEKPESKPLLYKECRTLVSQMSQRWMLNSEISSKLIHVDTINQISLTPLGKAFKEVIYPIRNKDFEKPTIHVEYEYLVNDVAIVLYLESDIQYVVSKLTQEQKDLVWDDCKRRDKQSLKAKTSFNIDIPIISQGSLTSFGSKVESEILRNYKPSSEEIENVKYPSEHGWFPEKISRLFKR